jgi:rhomboid protease GluP
VHGKATPSSIQPSGARQTTEGSPKGRPKGRPEGRVNPQSAIQKPKSPVPKPNPASPMIEAARYARVAEAHQDALALAAKELAYLIEREGDEWVLKVEETALEQALTEIKSVREEELRHRAAPPPAALEKIRPLSLFVFAWFMAASFFVQQSVGPRWLELGLADSEAILHGGQWWRTITALTLHGDLSHLTANLAVGILFAAFALPHFGTGLTWLLILLTGIFGNAINAWGYRGESHDSIGASTAVFGALGLLVGAEFWARWSRPATRTRWQLVLPLGAGLSLLAYLGVGDKHDQIDSMAHLWGFASGLGLGLAAAALRLKERLPRAAQWTAAILAVGVVAGAWAAALDHG